MLAALGEALEASWYRPPRLTLLLLPLSWAFAALTALRRHGFSAGWFDVYRAPCPVVVVGNINVGGTGKTPVVIALAKGLRERGVAVGVVSRGYGGSGGDEPLRVTATTPAVRAGDEAVLIAREAGVPVVVCRNRPAAVRALLEDDDLDLVLSDDGLQHYALGRDYEIVAIDSRRGLGNGLLLPIGPLREPPSRLGTVDWVLQRGGTDPHSGCPLEPLALRPLDGRPLLNLDSATLPERAHAVAGIGNPAGFFSMLEELGISIEKHIFPDHHSYSAADLAPLDDLPVIMTEKDAVKCEAFATASHYALQVQAAVPDALLEALAHLTDQRAGSAGEEAVSP